ncbi:NAD-dependent epimerase/dehydratase family protein [Gryllotalpicola ginsengisoli]|uniref:NAD-dependent epimerase/dehydratase family protein n=1 Tax=Gryllotalpicola ginsengisoli TaxID=444608 RepID=UPI0003B33C61|nr:NAD(P)-dependent oxidoreductase [Gryllotalpicola ginsengisoli]
MKRIAITGGGGRIGRTIAPRLAAEGYRVRTIDVTDAGGGEDHVVASVLDPAALDAALRDVDAVVHLAGHASERPWADLLALNIDGTQKVLEACVRAGVRNVLLASSIHAVGYATPEQLAGVEVAPPRPDTYYGVSKAALEALGSVFADRFGMAVVSARICTFADEPGDGRALASWLSPGDMVRLVRAAVELETPGHRIVWGVSRNSPGWFDLSAGEAIGYFPQDDAVEWVRDEADAPTIPERDELLGGEFADPGYALGHDASQ